MSTTTLTFAQRMQILKNKVANTTWQHTPFKSGEFAGKFVGVKPNGKFYIGITSKVLKGGNMVPRFANLNIDPEATGLTPDMFETQLSEADTKSLIESLFGAKAKIVVKESFTPMWETQEPTQDKNGNVVIKAGMPVYSQTLISDANDSDSLVNANNVTAPVLAEDTL